MQSPAKRVFLDIVCIILDLPEIDHGAAPLRHSPSSKRADAATKASHTEVPCDVDRRKDWRPPRLQDTPGRQTFGGHLFLGRARSLVLICRPWHGYRPRSPLFSSFLRILYQDGMLSPSGALANRHSSI